MDENRNESGGRSWHKVKYDTVEINSKYQSKEYWNTTGDSNKNKVKYK